MLPPNIVTMITPTETHLNSNLHIAVSSTSFSKSAVLRKELLRVFPNSIFTDHRQKLLGEKITEFIGDADAAIVGVEA